MLAIRDNVIETKSYSFAISIINVYKELQKNNEYVLSKQLLRSGTSIGANVKEGLRANSKKDFSYKMNIALKEANETEYWISLLIDTGYLDRTMSQQLLSDCKELCRILNSIVKTSRDNMLVEEETAEYEFNWSLID